MGGPSVDLIYLILGGQAKTLGGAAPPPPPAYGPRKGEGDLKNNLVAPMPSKKG